MPALADHRLTVETSRFGPFTFQVGVDAASVETPFLRVSDAHQRFQGPPLSQVASQLEREVVATSVFGTNSIEGGTLSEEETRQALDLDPSGVRNIEQRRVLNIKAAYVLANQAVVGPDWRLDLPFILSVHAAITNGIPHKHNQPGLLRDNPKAILIQVGDQAYGGG